MKYLLIASILFIGLGANAQSLMHSLPPYKPPVNKFERSIILPTDTLPSISTKKWQGFRLAGPDIMVAIPDFSAWTGIGIDYVFASANTTTGKWNYDYTIGIRAEGGANLPSPGNVKAVGGIGIRFTMFNGLLALGGIYNLTLKHAQAAVGNPAALIPGLN